MTHLYLAALFPRPLRIPVTPIKGKWSFQLLLFIFLFKERREEVSVLKVYIH